jgi:biotin-(acetyl-CoA carboxylase) ligase
VDEFTDQTPTAEELADGLAKQINRFYERLRGDAGAGEIIDEWRKRSSYFSGKAVRVVLENETIMGVTDGLEPNGALRVTTEGGLWIVQAGDVQHLRRAES